MKENKNIKPNLTLSMDDKVYLAVSKESTEKLAFVYTLACLKANKTGNTYNLFATREIHTFKDKDKADIYHDTIEKIVEKNSNDKLKEALFSANEELIAKFYENSR